MAHTISADRVTAVVSPRSLGGTSLFEVDQAFDEASVDGVKSDQSVVDDAVTELTALGFDVLSTSEATISIEGPKELFQDVFGVRLRKAKADVAEDTKMEFFEPGKDEEVSVLEAPARLRPLIEGVALSVPPEFFESPLPPLAPIDPNGYRYFFVPDEIGLLLRASRVHRTGNTGIGVTVAMPDTGFYKHPFYNWHGYRVKPTILAAGATDPAADLVGHGTGEAANIFAAAPDITLQPIKMGDPIDSIKKARSTPAKVVTNSWGYNIDKGSITWATLSPYLKALAAEVQLTVNAGKTVCFSAGNGHYGFPASMPSVIAVGGVHVNYPKLDFEASSYASSFVSKIYPGRRVPDVCGLTGKSVNIGGGPKAPSIMLPVQPGSSLDGIPPSTGSGNDGWGIFSGTSAASPQVAGVAALMLEKAPTLTPAKVKHNLMSTARDVTAGSTQMGDAAGPGPDLATGAGLVDAKWAYIISMGGVASRFFEATPAEQLELVEAGALPNLGGNFIEDLIETLRSS